MAPKYSTTPGINPNQLQQSSEFTNWLQLQTAEKLPITPYSPNTSLRSWFKTYEAIADSYGIPHQLLIRPSINLLPQQLQVYALKLNPILLTSWNRYQETLLARFGRPAEKEDQETMAKLNQLKQQRNQPLALHATDFDNTIRDLNKAKRDRELIDIFIRSLHSETLKYLLFSQLRAFDRDNSNGDPKDKKSLTLAEVVDEALSIEQNVYDYPSLFNDQPQQFNHQQNIQPIDEDVEMIGHIRHGQRNGNRNNNYNNNNHHNNNRRNNNNQQKRAWTENGKPICDVCGKIGHLTKRCYKNAKANRGNYTKSTRNVNSVQVSGNTNDTQKASENSERKVEINHISHVANTRYYSPHCSISIQGHDLLALVDTGAEISAIDYSTCTKLNLALDTTNSIDYQDINGNTTSTCGTAKVILFGKQVHLHVIQNLSKSLVIGYDLIKQLKGIVDSNKQQLIININGNKIDIPIASKSSNIFATSVLTPNEKQQIHQIIQHHSAIIPENNKKPSVTNLIEFTIDTGDSQPIFIPPRRLHPIIQQQMDTELEELISLNIISLVQSPQWASPAHMVKKADGSYRLVGDYKAINQVTKRIQYTFTSIHDALDSLGQATIFTKLDLASGYWQIPVKQEHRPKTALSTRNGVYQFNVMPFGLSNAPAVFQSLMDQVLSNLKWSCCTCYMDDIVIYSSSISQHLQHLQLVLDALLAANLSIKLSKCQFAVPKIKYLGFIISENGVTSDPDKIAPIINFPTPQTIKHVERFLGMANVYHRFISSFAVKSEPLRRLKKKETPFTWNTDQQHAFTTLKNDLASLPTLKQPNFILPFEIHSDAATTSGIAVILCQRHHDYPYPLSFASRSLSPAEKNYSVQELEALAIYWGIKKFRCYIECSPVTVYTDHSSLSWLLNTKEHHQPRLWRWSLFLKQFDINIQYIKGSNNHAADALSRHPLPSMHAISTSFTALNTIDWKSAQEKDLLIGKLKLKVNRKDSRYTLIDFILYKLLPRSSDKSKNNICLVVPSQLQSLVIQQHHASIWAGHFGINKTIKKIINSKLWWTTIYSDVKNFITKCNLCQQTKSPNHPIKTIDRDTTGNHPFHRVALDFFGPLPKTNNNSQYILVIVDTFSRYIELYPMPTTTQEAVVSILYNKFVPRHGLPYEWLSDNGPPFGSSFVNQLAQAFQIDIKFTPAYHPQSNGIVERMMGTIRRMIISYIDQPRINEHWDQHLRIFRFVHNTTTHDSTKNTPFFLVHGREARLPLISGNVITPPSYSHTSYKAPPISDYIDNMNSVLNTAYDVICNHKAKSSSLRPNPYAVNDSVLLFNTQQTRSQQHRHRKLLLDWVGPYTIKEINSPSTVTLIDSNNKVTKNVHISRIKQHHS